jgi:hypothetical protein
VFSVWVHIYLLLGNGCVFCEYASGISSTQQNQIRQWDWKSARQSRKKRSAEDLLPVIINYWTASVVGLPGYRSRDPGYDTRRYQIFWEIVGLDRGPPSLVRITYELHEWKSSGSGSRKWWLTSYPQKLALTSPTSDGRSVGVVRLRTKATEFSFMVNYFD